MLRRPPGPTLTYTLFPYPTLFRSGIAGFLPLERAHLLGSPLLALVGTRRAERARDLSENEPQEAEILHVEGPQGIDARHQHRPGPAPARRRCQDHRSEEHTSELQSLMRISYAVFCLTKKNTT